VAVILALVGTFAVYSYAHNADKRAVEGTRAAKVLIAQKAVPAGTSWGDVVKGGYLAVESIPAKSAPDNALQSLDAAVPLDYVATAGIASGQIVIRPMFDEKAPTTGVVKLSGRNMAISVALCPAADVAGFVQAGSVVAIFVTSNLTSGTVNSPTSNTSNNHVITKLLVPRVDVVAVSTQAPNTLNDANPKTSNNAGNTNCGNIGSGTTVLVTLSVSQADAERIILAENVGELYLALLTKQSDTHASPGTDNSGTFKPVPVFLPTQ
jgi:pilus assembly protein CpaB